MSKVMNLIRKYRFFWIYLVIALLFFGMLTQPDFATDTYVDFGLASRREVFMIFTRSGRFVTALAYGICMLLGLSFGKIYLITFAGAVTALALSMYFLREIVEKFIKNSALAIIIPVLILINPFTIELFMFIEKGSMLVSVLCVVLSAKFFLRWLDSQEKKWLVVTMLLTLLATCCYQGTLGLAIALMTTIIVLKCRGIRDFGMWTIASVGVYAFGAIANIILTRLVTSNVRALNGLNVGATLVEIARQLPRLFHFSNIIPIAIVVAWWIIILVVMVWTAWKNRSLKATASTLMKMLYLAVVVFLAAIAPQISLGPEGVSLAPRSTFVFAAYFGIATWIVIADLFNEVEYKLQQNIIVAASLILLATTGYMFNRIITDHYKMNALDKERAQMIGTEIANYEDKTGQTISMVRFYTDLNPSYSYQNLFVSGDINLSAFIPDWSRVYVLNYWNGRNLINTDSEDERFAEFCAASDWQHFTTEQLKFSGNTLYICNF